MHAADACHARCAVCGTRGVMRACNGHGRQTESGLPHRAEQFIEHTQHHSKAHSRATRPVKAPAYACHACCACVVPAACCACEGGSRETKSGLPPRAKRFIEHTQHTQHHSRATRPVEAPAYAYRACCACVVPAACCACQGGSRETKSGLPPRAERCKQTLHASAEASEYGNVCARARARARVCVPV
jgi:hypothetical protein